MADTNMVRVIIENDLIGNGVVLSMLKPSSGIDRLEPYYHFGLLPNEAIRLGRELISAGEAVLDYEQRLRETK